MAFSGESYKLAMGNINSDVTGMHCIINHHIAEFVNFFYIFTRLYDGDV